MQKGGVGVVSQKGDGEARENDLENFVASLTVRAWELPQKCHDFTVLMTLLHFSHSSPSSPPNQQRLFSTQRKSNGFYLNLSFPLTVPFFSQVHSPLLCKCEWGVPRAAPLATTRFVFFFFFFPADPSSLTGALGPPLVHKHWGSPPF